MKLLQWALSYLSDNGPNDDYLYILTVFTGLHRNAGTKSRIGFMIIDGKPKKSHLYEPDIRLLDDETHRVSFLFIHVVKKTVYD